MIEAATWRGSGTRREPAGAAADDPQAPGAFDTLFGLGDCAAAPLDGDGTVRATAQAASRNRSLAERGGRDGRTCAGLYKAHLIDLFSVWRTAALVLSGALRRSTLPATNYTGKRHTPTLALLQHADAREGWYRRVSVAWSYSDFGGYWSTTEPTLLPMNIPSANRVSMAYPLTLAAHL